MNEHYSGADLMRQAIRDGLIGHFHRKRTSTMAKRWQFLALVWFMFVFNAYTGGFMTHAFVPQRPQPAAEEPTRQVKIVVDPIRNVLMVYADGELIKKYPIALGKEETPTPVGDFYVINKYRNWGKWFGTRWIGLNVEWGTYGIHGTNRPESIGRDASHGCIRMLNRHIEELYEMVTIGTKVTILGHVLGEPDQMPRRLAKGHVGGDVMLVQNRLRAAGYYHGKVNGKFDDLTDAAMRRFERDAGLQVDGVVGWLDYIELGLLE